MTSSYIRTDPPKTFNTETEVSTTAWCEHETDKHLHSVPRSQSKSSCVRCRAELSEGHTAPAPSSGTSTPSAHTSCHHITPGELYSSPWHPITPISQAFRDFFFYLFLRNSKSWSLHYSPTAHEQMLDRLNHLNQSEFSAVLLPKHFSLPCHHTPASPPAF